MLTPFATGAKVLTAIAGAGKAAQALAIGTLGTFEFTFADANQWNVILNVFTIAVAVGLAMPVVKNRRKDQTIKDLQDSNAAKDTRVKELRDSLEDAELQKRQIEQGAAHCHTEAARWEAKYEEAKQYTAREAVEHFEEALSRHSGLVAERHAVLIEQGQANALALGQVAATLTKLQERFDS